MLTFLLGAAFLANQLAEYATLAFTADDHPYGSIYWLLTGLHSCHVTAGLVAMALLFVRIGPRPVSGRRSPRGRAASRCSGTSSTSSGCSCSRPSG